MLDDVQNVVRSAGCHCLCTNIWVFKGLVALANSHSPDAKVQRQNVLKCVDTQNIPAAGNYERCIVPISAEPRAGKLWLVGPWKCFLDIFPLRLGSPIDRCELLLDAVGQSVLQEVESASQTGGEHERANQEPPWMRSNKTTYCSKAKPQTFFYAGGV